MHPYALLVDTNATVASVDSIIAIDIMVTQHGLVQVWLKFVHHGLIIYA